MSSMPRRAAPCYNCGTIARTRDHVFPRSLFTRPRPSPSPTVPACHACQRRTGLDEVYFRSFVAGGAYQHPTARALWDSQIVRSFGYDSHVTCLVLKVAPAESSFVFVMDLV
jgi:hypothetical protein